jgi:hypothetical protein
MTVTHHTMVYHKYIKRIHAVNGQAIDSLGKSNDDEDEV